MCLDGPAWTGRFCKCRDRRLPGPIPCWMAGLNLAVRAPVMATSGNRGRGTAHDRRGRLIYAKTELVVLRERSKPPISLNPAGFRISCSVAIVRTGRSRCLPRELLRNLRNLPSDILDWENMIYIPGFYGARRHIRPLGCVGRLCYSNAAGFLDFP